MFTYELTDIKLDQRGLYSVLKSQRGPVAEHIRSIGRATVVTSKALAGVRTGKLKRSIKMTRDRSDPTEYAVLVGSDVNHALVHHEGARRHVIRPRRPGGVLAFPGRGGTTVYTRRVNHPGHRGNKYLTRALRIAMTR
jgi:hypothetical protein